MVCPKLGFSKENTAQTREFAASDGNFLSRQRMESELLPTRFNPNREFLSDAKRPSRTHSSPQKGYARETRRIDGFARRSFILAR